MLRTLFAVAAAVAAIIVVASCSDHRDRLPAAPTATAIPPATPGAAPGATPITLGQSTTQVLTLADPPCGIELSPTPPEPCRQFAVTASRRGLLKVRLTSSDPGELTLRVGTRIYWGNTVDVAATVESDSTYGIAVALHSGRATHSFELIATLEPF